MWFTTAKETKNLQLWNGFIRIQNNLTEIVTWWPATKLAKQRMCNCFVLQCANFYSKKTIVKKYTQNITKWYPGVSRLMSWKDACTLWLNYIYEGQ